MSKYENEHFANMKISIFLIFIGFTHFVFSCDQNISDESYPTCPVNLFRRKRALQDYTRWRANPEPTAEFIVKILDDDLSTMNTKPIVAVNFQPVTKVEEKIIVGGAMVSMPQTKSVSATSETLKDYTRFVPPTTVATRIEGDFYIAPAQSEHRVIHPIHPIIPNSGTDSFKAAHSRPRHPQRDESPPAKPQFVPRSDVGAAARQYAPIAPVGFTRHNKIAPLTPPLQSTNSYNFRKSLAQLRTTPFEDVLIPTRTKSDSEEFGNLLTFHEDSDSVTRTTFVPLFEPRRTMTGSLVTTEDDLMPTTIEMKANSDNGKKKGEKDDTYGMFYNYNDNVGDGIKKEKGTLRDDLYDDKVKVPQDEQQIIEADVTTEAVFLITDNALPPKQSLQENNDIAVDSENSKRNKYVSNAELTETATKASMKDILREKRIKAVCSMIKLRDLNFNSPRTLPEIEAQLKKWAESSPVAKWVDITDGNYTTMERPIYMMIVDDPSSGQIISAKQTVLIVAGILGRDQHAVASAMYVLYQLIERSEAHSDLLSKYRFWIIPVFNPDGYDYAMTFPQRREWTKNLQQKWEVCKGREACSKCETYGIRCIVQSCYGVNLDRNFEYQWIPADELRAEHPCGPLYAGARQLSEAETIAFTQYLHKQYKLIYTFIAFKEGEVLGVMYPYSHTKKKRAFEHIYKQRASRAASAAYSINGRPYVAGQTSQFLPLYAGGIEDWVDGHLGVDNTYTIMMYRPADTYNSKLITERVVHEAYAAMDTLVLQSAEEPAVVVEAVTVSRSIVTSSALTASVDVMLLVYVTSVHVYLT